MIVPKVDDVFLINDLAIMGSVESIHNSLIRDVCKHRGGVGRSPHALRRLGNTTGLGCLLRRLRHSTSLSCLLFWRALAWSPLRFILRRLRDNLGWVEHMDRALLDTKVASIRTLLANLVGAYLALVQHSALVTLANIALGRGSGDPVPRVMSGLSSEAGDRLIGAVKISHAGQERRNRT